MKRINQMEPWVGEEEKEELVKTIESGWITEAGRTKEFERLFANYVGSQYASAVNNGTLSLAIGLMALGIGKGDEVIVPDFTMIASANGVKLAGAEPVLVDIDRQTLCLDVAAAEAAITSKTKAIMPVPLNGRSPDMTGLMILAQKRSIFILEDAAQALGSRCQGKHLGTWGEIGSFSLSTPKVITTGQGGVLVTNNEELYQRIVKIKDFGRRRRSEDYHEILGYNFKFTDIQAALGLAQMKKLEWRVNRKKEMYHLYRELLTDVDQIELIATDLEQASPWFIDILVPAETRDSLISFLDQQGIGSRPFYYAIHTMPPYAYIQGHFPNSEDVAARGIWLPSSTFLTDEDIERVCQEIRQFFRTTSGRK
ncbi:MAG: DegT/DnrJ/EryC1/StrS family aminotransferase [Chloroflexi bacterium]|nr:DegT/DnrJ/EryC1/StrS family aminotransferase [Chloroflexota bacterium]